NTGTITLSNNAALNTGNANLINASSGIIQGTGTINLGAGNLLTNQGTMSAGASPGTLNITGDLTMTSSSVTSIEIQAPGTTAGTDYDRINVTGAVSFDGALNITHPAG